MSNEKIINSRQQQKHDIEANWLKAVNFIPKDGELIIYDVDEANTIPRVKIGDGNRSVSNLPFIGEDVLQKISEIELLTIVDEGDGNLVFDGIGYGSYEEFEERIENLEQNSGNSDGKVKYYTSYLQFDGEGNFWCDDNSVSIYEMINKGYVVRLCCEQWGNCYYYPVYISSDDCVCFMRCTDDAFLEVILVWDDNSANYYEYPIPSYTENGCLTSNPPVEKDDVATKGYVDGKVLDAHFSYEDGEYFCEFTSTELHEKMTEGYTVRLVSDSGGIFMPVMTTPGWITFADFDSGYIYMYVLHGSGKVTYDEVDLAVYNKNGCLVSNMPEEDNEVAVKEYVDMTAWENRRVYAWAQEGEDYFITEADFDSFRDTFVNYYLPVFLVIESVDADWITQCSNVEYDATHERFIFYFGSGAKYYWEKANSERIYI